MHKRDVHTGASWQTLLVTGGCFLYRLLQPDADLRCDTGSSCWTEGEEEIVQGEGSFLPGFTVSQSFCRLASHPPHIDWSTSTACKQLAQSHAHLLQCRHGITLSKTHLPSCRWIQSMSSSSPALPHGPCSQSCHLQHLHKTRHLPIIVWVWNCHAKVGSESPKLKWNWSAGPAHLARDAEAFPEGLSPALEVGRMRTPHSVKALVPASSNAGHQATAVPRWLQGTECHPFSSRPLARDSIMPAPVLLSFEGEV